MAVSLEAFNVGKGCTSLPLYSKSGLSAKLFNMNMFLTWRPIGGGGGGRVSLSRYTLDVSPEDECKFEKVPVGEDVKQQLKAKNILVIRTHLTKPISLSFLFITIYE